MESPGPHLWHEGQKSSHAEEEGAGPPRDDIACDRGQWPESMDSENVKACSCVF